MFLKALLEVYGHKHVFLGPEVGTFPLVDLPGKKVVFLDEWRFDQTVLRFATQDQWFDGSAMRINRPQNVPGVCGHMQYRGMAPIFITTKLGDIARLRQLAADNPATGSPFCSEASMLLRRLKIFEFDTRIPKPPKTIQTCGSCFANILLEAGANKLFFL